jgi:CubicO group peptidase (beta-lactamase class C family)
MSALHPTGSFALAALVLTGAPASVVAQTSLDEALCPFLSRYDLPAVAAAVVHEGKVVASGAVGTRKTGAAIPVTIHDRWHLGSNGKAMTSLLAAILVDEGKLKWTSTLPDVFPELADKIAPELKSATLEQFLNHTSGLPGDTDPDWDLIGRATLRDKENLDEQRYWIVKEASRRPVAAAPEKKWAYSNIGYVLAGAMLEKVNGKPWEDLIAERLFGPLELRSAGFGPQVSLGRIDAPVPHMFVDGKLKSFPGGPSADNPPTAGPAGTAYMSVLDFARWAGWHAGAGKRGPQLVKAETLKKLHTPTASTGARKNVAPGTPPEGKYGLGWMELKIDFIPNPILFHGGSNEKNLAHIFVDPKNDRALVIVSNVGGKKADEGFRALMKELYLKHMVPSGVGK